MKPHKRSAKWALCAVFAAQATLALASCSAPPKGILMVALQSDMAVPKDIDIIRIIVTVASTGEVKFNQAYGKDADGEIKLPATLGLLAPEDPSKAISIRLIASKEREEEVRVLREVVTTVPKDRAATLEMPIHFLCDESGRAELDANGQPKRDSVGNVIVANNCPDGQTCVTGSCVENTVDSTHLPDYDVAQIFGGGDGSGNGDCFDARSCFASATPVPLDLDTFSTSGETSCRAKASGGVNVAIATQSSGDCNAKGCFIALDAESDAGFRKGADGFIDLPPALCKKAISGELIGVVTAPVSAECSQKRSSLPLCGPWSSTGASKYKPEDPTKPAPVVAGQYAPGALAMSAYNLYWTTGSTFDPNDAPNTDGAIKSTPLEGGEPLALAKGESSPGDLVIDPAKQFVFWTETGKGALKWAAFGLEDQKNTLHSGLGQPAGITLFANILSFTDLATNEISQVAYSVNAGAPTLSDAPTLVSTAGVMGKSPYRLAAASDAICFTLQGQLNASDGAVGCTLSGMSVQVSNSPGTPRAIALERDGNGKLVAVYWASFEQAGSVYMAQKNGAAFDTPIAIASGESYPSGLAVDADAVYWTNRGDNTVKRYSKLDKSTSTIATDQNKPGAIAIASNGDVYWINEGSGQAADGTPIYDGAIMRLAKAPPGAAP